MNVTQVAKKLTEMGHKNAYQKLNFILNGAVGMIPKDNASFFDDAITIIKQESKDDTAIVTEQKKAYLKIKK